MTSSSATCSTAVSAPSSLVAKDDDLGVQQELETRRRMAKRRRCKREHQARARLRLEKETTDALLSTRFLSARADEAHVQNRKRITFDLAVTIERPNCCFICNNVFHEPLDQPASSLSSSSSPSSSPSFSLPIRAKKDDTAKDDDDNDDDNDQKEREKGEKERRPHDRHHRYHRRRHRRPHFHRSSSSTSSSGAKSVVEREKIVEFLHLPQICDYHVAWPTGTKHISRQFVADMIKRVYGPKNTIRDASLAQFRRLCTNCFEKTVLACATSVRAFSRTSKNAQRPTAAMICPFCPRSATSSSNHLVDMDALVANLSLPAKTTFRAAHKRAVAALDPSTFFCPVAGCSYFVAFDAQKQKLPLISCPHHGFYCGKCWKAFGTEKAVEMHRCRELPDELLSTEFSKDVRRCPHCFLPIQKNAGCNNMLCVCCKNFNWQASPMVAHGAQPNENSNQESDYEYEYESEYSSDD